MVAEVDAFTNYTQRRLAELNLDRFVNTIYLSDHGMASVIPENFIDLRKFLKNDSFEMVGTSPVIQVVPKNGADEKQILFNLTQAAKANGHFKVYTNENVPKRWKANNPLRLGPVLVVSDIPYGFQDLFEAAEYYAKQFNITSAWG